MRYRWRRRRAGRTRPPACGPRGPCATGRAPGDAPGQERQGARLVLAGDRACSSASASRPCTRSTPGCSPASRETRDAAAAGAAGVWEMAMFERFEPAARQAFVDAPARGAPGRPGQDPQRARPRRPAQGARSSRRRADCGGPGLHELRARLPRGGARQLPASWTPRRCPCSASTWTPCAGRPTRPSARCARPGGRSRPRPPAGRR